MINEQWNLIGVDTRGTMFLCFEYRYIHMAQFWERYNPFIRLARWWNWRGRWVVCYGLAIASLFGTVGITLLAIQRHAYVSALLGGGFVGATLYSLGTFVAVWGQHRDGTACDWSG